MQIQEIETVLLCHHPDNPRTGYGDIEELKESIRQQGILQPLTVVHIGTGRHYNVVAGNRRLEAAKSIGLKTCPCIVSDMDEKTQAAVILVENMVRKNLNPYEECKGVQLCLDLGMDEDEISKKTGFSKGTIRHRKKMSELDQDILKTKCQDGQIDIQQIISLEKIKDPDKRNKVLETAGTSNFGYSLQSTLREEQTEADREKAYNTLLSFAEEMPADWSDSKYMQVGYGLSGDVEIPEDAKEEAETPYAFKLTWSGGSTYSLYKVRDDVEEGEDPEESEYELTRRKKNEAKEKLNRLGFVFFEMRKEFMKNNTTFNGNVIQWLAYLLLQDDFGDEDAKACEGFSWGQSYGFGFDYELYAEIMGEQSEIHAEDVVRDMKSAKTINHADAALLIYCMLECKERIHCANWDGTYKADDVEYPRLYDFMEQCGYKISDEEKKILDGSHEDYYEEK